MRPAAAINHLIALEEVLGSWQGDDTVQFVELRMLAADQNHLSQGARLAIDDASGDPDHRRFLTFQLDASFGFAGGHILIATRPFTNLTRLLVDFVMPAGVLQPRAGRICYQAPAGPLGEIVDIDCVAYGAFLGDNGSFGRPTPLNPDDRSLQHNVNTSDNRRDWIGVLEPTPENNAGTRVTMGPTLCGNGRVDPGEQCEANDLQGNTCADLDFVKGTLACEQCHFDTSGCSFCGNGKIDRGEECDGDDLAGLDCTALGFTGGALSCGEGCRISTAGCDPTFFIPGGKSGPDCLAEWRILNAAGRPGATGPVPARQTCKDGDIGCDQDAPHGTCTFLVSVCLGRDDARLRRAGHPCRPRAVRSWSVLRPVLDDADLTGRLLAAVAALGPSTIDRGTVLFSPPLGVAGAPLGTCTEPVSVTVSLRETEPGSRVLRAQAVAPGGRPRDVDVLKLTCTP